MYASSPKETLKRDLHQDDIDAVSTCIPTAWLGSEARAAAPRAQPHERSLVGSAGACHVQRRRRQS